MYFCISVYDLGKWQFCLLPNANTEKQGDFTAYKYLRIAGIWETGWTDKCVLVLVFRVLGFSFYSFNHQLLFPLVLRVRSLLL